MIEPNAAISTYYSFDKQAHNQFFSNIQKLVLELCLATRLWSKYVRER